MNQQGFIVPLLIAVVIVGVIGAGAVVYFTRQPAVQPINDIDEEIVQVPLSSSTPSVAPQTESSFTGKVTDLLKRGQNLSCTFDRADQTGTISGTVYIASQGQRMRGDFKLTQPDATVIDSHMIRDGQYNYFWTDQLPQGTKIIISEEDIKKAEEQTSTPDTAGQQQVLDKDFNYRCRSWSVDTSMFNLPPDKEFVDLTAQLKQIQDATVQQLPQR